MHAGFAVIVAGYSETHLNEASMSKGPQPGIGKDQWLQLINEKGWLWTPTLRADAHEAPTLLLAHGAGAPMDSDFMSHMATDIAAQGVSVLRFEFPYMALRRHGGSKRPPNPQAQLLECWREVYALVRPFVAGRLAVGGKSMGGRMASLIADDIEADALVCLGYPFYAVGKPEKPRVAHLAELKTPALIVQGERDALGNREAVEGYALSSAIQLHWLPTANHDLKPLKVAGISHEQCLVESAQVIARFLRT
ncbi:esterase [Pseudomonas savastanoi]|nr:esterase [Pseudomonas amygdali pv. tabaci str. ATCC 11528]QOI05783.1 esterase [Pseudomonas savastanoi]